MVIRWKSLALCCPWNRRSSDFNRRSVARVVALLSLPVSLFCVASVSRAQTSTVGQWSPVSTWPYKLIHAHLLSTGKVLYWPRADNSSQIPFQLWDPATNAFSSVPQPGANIFCSGHAFLADGRLLQAGGHIQSFYGLISAYIYSPYTNSWTQLPDMNNARWYPTNTTLSNGDMLVAAGEIDPTQGMDPEPQVWQTATASWRNLSTADLVLPYYPYMYVAPNGKVFMAGS